MDESEKTIDCPRCWVAMKKQEVAVRGPNVIIDVCPKCHGVLFDNNELKEIPGDRKLANFLTTHIGTQSKSKLACPRCSWLMDLEYAEEVEIDVCLNSSCGDIISTVETSLEPSSRNEYPNIREIKRTFRTGPAI